MALTVSVVNMSLHVKTKNSDPFRGAEKVNMCVCVCACGRECGVCMCAPTVRVPPDKDMKIR